MSSKRVQPFFDSNTFTMTYLIYDEQSKDAVLIDPVLDFDPVSSEISYSSIEKVAKFIHQNELRLSYVLETHVHADHLSAGHELRSRFPGLKIVISHQINSVQETFQEIFNLDDINSKAQCFDILVRENDEINCGTILIKVMETPGHTPACVSFLIDNMVFVGDALFMPDFGTGRCDFPNGSAENLFHSVREKLYKLPDEVRVYVGHDYQPNGRDLKFQTTIGESKNENIHLRYETKKEEFISFREKRDSTLSLPKLLFPSVQINIRAGQLPPVESNGVHYLKIPLKKEKSFL